MQKKIDNLYEKIKDLKTKQEFLEETKKIQKKYDDLLDIEAAALLLVDKLGRNKGAVKKICDLEPGIECTINARVTSIGKMTVFNKKKGGEGRVINLVISDDSGSCGLALWHKDVDLVNKNKIKIDSEIKIVNGYVKSGYNGLEINVGRWGVLDILSKEEETIDKKNLKKEEKNDVISGTILNIKPSNAFFRDDGSFGFVTKLELKTKDDRKQIILWDDKVKEIQKFKKGDQVKISNLNIKSKNGIKEYHLNSHGVIKKD